MTTHFVSDKVAKGRVTHALTQSFETGGFDAMIARAFEIEAGKGPFHVVDNRRQWLIGVLNDLSQKFALEPNQVSRLHMYRDDLRRGR